LDPRRLSETSPGPGIEPGEPEKPSRRLRLVLVDDHVIVREALADLLSGDPRLAIVGEASNGRDAVQLVRKEHPDIVLMDVVMPEVDGIQATRMIKSELPDIAVVGLSMLADEDTRRQMLEAGACAHLGKETELPVLLATLFGCAA
jgi:DNA-binding NarL/FixJ family response regulator